MPINNEFNFKHPSQGKIVRNIKRPSLAAIKSLSKCDTAFISDSLGKYNVMHYSIKPLDLGMKLCGPAITCLGYDRLVRRMAINLSTPGDVLVLATGGIVERSCFGGTTARQMQLKDLNGVIIDGSTRDAEEIRSLHFPTFVRAVTPQNFHYPADSVEHGAVNVEVCCGGVVVRPGDVVVGDGDGVVVVPRDVAEKFAGIIEQSLYEKKANRDQINASKKFDVEEELQRRGYIFIDSQHS